MRDSSRLLSVSSSVSLPAKLIDSSMPAVTIPMIRTTTKSSSSVNPACLEARLRARAAVASGATPRLLGEVPVADIGVGTVATLLVVGAQRVQVIGLSMRAWIRVLVRMSPGVIGKPLHVGPVPMRHRGVVRLLDQRLQAVVSGRVLGVVEAVFGEGGLEALDVLLRL